MIRFSNARIDGVCTMELSKIMSNTAQKTMTKLLLAIGLNLFVWDSQGQSYQTVIQSHGGYISRVNVLDTVIDFKGRSKLHDVFINDTYFGPAYCLNDTSCDDSIKVKSSPSTRVNCEPEGFTYKLSYKDSSCLRCYTVFWDTLMERLTCLVVLKQGALTQQRRYCLYAITEQEYLKIPEGALVYVGPLKYYLNESSAYAWVFIE